MKVTEKDNQLIVQSRFRSAASMLIFGLIFFVSGLIPLWFGGRTAALDCTRLETHEVHCEVRETIFNLPVRRAQVVNPQQAIAQESEDSDGGTGYRVALVAARGTIPLNENFASDMPADRLSHQINQFLIDTEAKTLNIAQPPSSMIYIFPICFSGAGLLLILSIHFQTYTFDRDRDVLIIKRESLRGTRKREEPLRGLRAVVRESKDSDGDPIYGVHVLLASGTDIALGPGSSRAAAQQQLADRIQNFIKSGVRITYVDVKD